MMFVLSVTITINIILVKKESIKTDSVLFLSGLVIKDVKKVMNSYSK